MILSTKMHKGSGFYGMLTGMALLLAFSGCGSTSTSSGGGGGPFNSTQLSGLAQIFAASANSAATMSTTSYTPLKTNNMNPLSSCGPSTLIPPYSCPGSGNIYYTLSMDCTMPTGCCYAQPKATCKQDSMSINGSGSVNYNSCAETTKAGDHIMINGTIHMALTSNATMQCGGAVDVDVTVTFTGMPTISVNGHDVCHGDVFITAKGHAGASNYASVSGTVCGQRIYENYNYGCSVTCADKSCCYAGMICDICNGTKYGCIPAGAVSCCNGNYCPAPYKTCNASANTCSLSFNGSDLIPTMPSFWVFR